MPAVSEQFKTYREFASATLLEIYGTRLDTALKLTANCLESGVWINQSSPGKPLHFSWQPLPYTAQLSPINDIVSGDFNSNGKPELILAQGHDSNWIETGLWRGTPGTHLEWNGKTWQAIPHRLSGILLPTDTRSLIAIPKSGLIVAGQNNGALLLFKSSD